MKQTKYGFYCFIISECQVYAVLKQMVFVSLFISECIDIVLYSHHTLQQTVCMALLRHTFLPIVESMKILISKHHFNCYALSIHVPSVSCLRYTSVLHFFQLQFLVSYRIIVSGTISSSSGVEFSCSLLCLIELLSVLYR